MNAVKKLSTLLLALTAALCLTAAASAAEKLPYADVTEKNWFYDAVSFVTEEDLMDGLTETAFGPSRNLTRQMLAEALYRLAGFPETAAENPFTDVTNNAAYKDAVVWAYGAGVVNGLTETTFSPDASIERQDIAAMLARFLDADLSGEEGLDAFKDAAAVRGYAKGALSWAVANGLIQGNPDGTVNPRGNATRAQAAAILQRFAPMTGDREPTQTGLQRSAERAIAKQQYQTAADCFRKMEEAGFIGGSELGQRLFDTAYAASQTEAYTVCVELLEEAADLENAAAVNELGGCYLTGRGVKKDEEKALELYKKAAEMESPSALYNVGVCYAYGHGVEADEAAAFQWFQKAAEAGSPSGMFAAGAWYAEGKGVKADEEQARAWLEKYAASGNSIWSEQAQAILEELEAA